MGRDIEAREYTRGDHTRYRAAVRRCLDALEQMLDEGMVVEEEWHTGLELELNLVTDDMRPSMNNLEVLEHIDDDNYTNELGRFTVELNVEPRRIDGQSLLSLESALRKSLHRADDRAGDLGARLVAIGMLPTLDPPTTGSEWLTPSPRYEQLNDAVLRARREDIEIDIAGAEHLQLTSDSIAIEAACTSMQLHLQVAPERFARYWNAAQVLAGPQLALCANSPYLFGKQLWAETRPEVFLQSTDPRSAELRNQGVRPLVPFGERWITSIADLFEENVNYYPTLLPETSDEDPLEALAAGRIPRLDELRLHNGTIYRWNRPVYDVGADGRPHLRVENRVLPAGPTAVDMVANAAFFWGAVVELVHSEDPIWAHMSFDAAHQNFLAGARDGAAAQLYWPGAGRVEWDEIVLRVLLPMAQAGLERLGVHAAVIDRYLGTIEERARLRTNGSAWQVATVTAFERRGLSRSDALAAMLKEYITGMRSNQPVHSWPAF